MFTVATLAIMGLINMVMVGLVNQGHELIPEPGQKSYDDGDNEDNRQYMKIDTLMLMVVKR